MASWRMRLARWLVRGTGYEVLSPAEKRVYEDIILAQADRLLRQEQGLYGLARVEIAPSKPERMH